MQIKKSLLTILSLLIASTLNIYSSETIDRNNQVKLDEQLTKLIESNGSAEEIEYFLQKGADPDAKLYNSVFPTPFFLACGTRNSEVVKMLIQHGANIYIENSRGQTAFRWLSVRINLNNTRDITRDDEESIDSIISYAEIKKLLMQKHQQYNIPNEKTTKKVRKKNLVQKLLSRL